MIAQLDIAGISVALAVVCYIAGLLFRDQIILRLLLLAGSGFYIVYYSTAAQTPLWYGIAGSIGIVAANLWGLSSLVLSRRPSTVPHRQRGIREAMGRMEPGLFRRLMRLGDEIRAGRPVTLTEEGARPGALWFLASGRARLVKGGRAGWLEGPCFVGEVSWLTGSPASAEVSALPGAVLIRWERAELRRAVRRSVRLETALEAAIAVDMARKVTLGRPSLDEEAEGDSDAAWGVEDLVKSPPV